MPLDPGVSTLVATEISNAAEAPAIASESIIGKGVPIPWGHIDGSQVRVGVSGLFTMTTNPITIRIRVGGIPNNRGEVAGTIVHTFVVPVGNNQLFDELSIPVANPGTDSYIQVTAQGGPGTFRVDHMSVYIVPDGPAQMMLLGTRQEFVGDWDTFEHVGIQWLVDFDYFDSDDIIVAIAARTYNAVSGSVQMKVRIGGDYLAEDGDVVIDHLSNNVAHDGALVGDFSQIAKPTGRQFVKLSSEGSFGANSILGSSILLKAVV